MTIAVQTKIIGGIKFELEQLPAWTAFEAFQRFLAVVGPLFPVLALAFKAQASKDGVKGLSAEQRGVIFEGIVTQLPTALAQSKPEETKALAQLMLQSCTVIGKAGKDGRVSFNEVGDELLRGKLGVLLQLLAWAVGVHFGSFFGELGAMAPAPPAPEPSSSDSPTK